MDATAADELLRSAESARRKTRRARRALWLPPLIFGLVVLGATPLYHPVAEPPGSAIVCTGNVETGITCPSGPIATIPHTVHRASPLDFVGGLSLPNNGHEASLYWLIALPLGYALTAVLFYRRTKNRGVATSVLPYVSTGIALLAFLFVISPGFAHVAHIPRGLVRWQQFPFFQGLTPLLTIALGLFVLAWTERSWGYASFAVVFLGIACMAGAYNVENLFFRLGWTVPAPQINVIVPGAVLLLGAGLFRLVDLRRA